MAKTLVVGDIHLKAYDILPKVDEILESDENISCVVFLGDMCDEWNSDDGCMMRELEEFADWVEARRADGLVVDVLLGNHDFQYLLGQPGPGTHDALYGFVKSVLLPLNPRMACEVDGFLLTHAGLTQAYADEHLSDPEDAADVADQLNELLDDGTLEAFETLAQCGIGRGGDEIPGPLWADKWELEEDPIAGIPQIVGHTPVTTACSGEGARLEDAPKLWFCDTFSLMSNMVPIGDGSMLIVDDDTINVVHP